MPTFIGTKYTRIAETFSVEAETKEKAKELVENGECDILATDPEDGDDTIEFDELEEYDNPTDTGEDEQAFLAKISPYQQRAKDENLEITFHIFAEGGYNDWRDNPTEALTLYRDHIHDGICKTLC